MTSLLRSRRRRWLVDRKLQIPFVAIVLVQATAASLAFAIGSLVVSRRMSALLLRFIQEQDAPLFGESVTRAGRSFLLGSVLALLIGALAHTLFALYTSNRLAGPLLRLRHMLAELAAGNSSQRAAFRRRDRLDELAEIVNRRMEVLDEAHSRLKAEIPFLASAAQNHRAEIEAGKFPIETDELRRLEATLRQIADFWRQGDGGSAR